MEAHEGGVIVEVPCADCSGRCASVGCLRDSRMRPQHTKQHSATRTDSPTSPQGLSAGDGFYNGNKDVKMTGGPVYRRFMKYLRTFSDRQRVYSAPKRTSWACLLSSFEYIISHYIILVRQPSFRNNENGNNINN